MATRLIRFLLLLSTSAACGCAPKSAPPVEARGISSEWQGVTATPSVSGPLGVAPVLHAFETATRASFVPDQARAEFEVRLDRDGRITSIHFIRGDSTSWPRICPDVRRAIRAEPGAAVPATELPLTMRLEVKSIPPARGRSRSARGSYERVGPRTAQARVVSWSASDAPSARGDGAGQPCS
jgi:hypothetical protein